MNEHPWAPLEHQDVPIYAADSLPLDRIGSPDPVDPPQPVTVRDLRFDQIGVLAEVKAFAVARSEVAVFVEISWQGRLQRAWVPRDAVTIRTLRPRDRLWRSDAVTGGRSATRTRSPSSPAAGPR
ncbi:hypothetical protein C1N91_07530 [Curtobacterium sp. SGAir0471]|uniref:hypothetical protein n=1 Tax=Curtobacterium sp. SGAir0471 TaxID=2070337 RepID=UPI0010CCF503|nr:hypothetical protein [Curtobacterium sp. SGAir0471]QCR43419.1 hypothetical protein C1N91_07530 [Curtobacterium sp. SGAir0471]